MSKKWSDKTGLERLLTVITAIGVGVAAVGFFYPALRGLVGMDLTALGFAIALGSEGFQMFPKNRKVGICLFVVSGLNLVRLLLEVILL